MIDVVYIKRRWDVDDDAVHRNSESSFLDWGPLSPDSVKRTAVFGSIPFVFAQPVKIFGVNNCVFALCERDAPEGIAIANPPELDQ